MPVKPSDAEEEYFKKRELERLRKAARERASAVQEQERGKLKELHWMRCPKCGMELTEVDFRGVEVDACFACGGMFFDKGEIEKVAEKKESGWFDDMFSSLFGSKNE